MRIMDLIVNPLQITVVCVDIQVRTTPAEIADYFVYFLKLKPFGTIDMSEVRMLAKDLAMNSGIYTFKLNNNGTESLVQARYRC